MWYEVVKRPRLNAEYGKVISLVCVCLNPKAHADRGTMEGVIPYKDNIWYEVVKRLYPDAK
jgi:hypothetical protein